MKQIWKRRWARCLIITLSVFFALYLLRHPILRAMGNYLVSEDPLVHTQAIFILGGNSYERGLEGARVHRQFEDVPLVCTGGNVPLQIMALDTIIPEAVLTKIWLEKQGVPDTLVAALPQGTSTMEESDLILAYCLDRGWNDITLISSAYHLRRIRHVFERKFRKAGITIHLHGAGSKNFNGANWWQNEEGLIITNNEYVKMVYYFFKY